MRVTLQDDAEMLEETVVIGYGVQKKSDLTGAVASVRSEDLKDRSTTDAAAAFRVRLPVSRSSTPPVLRVKELPSVSVVTLRTPVRSDRSSSSMV